MAVAFARVLRGVEIAAPLDSVLTFVDALSLVGIDNRESVYWAARCTLARNPEDIPAFDRAFAVFWDHRTANGEPETEESFDGPAVDRDRVSDRACLFATSGTTGAPKIVGIPHQVVLFDIARQVQDLFLGPDDRIDLLCHPSFSASLSSIFSALLTGAELHLRHPAAPLDRKSTRLNSSHIPLSRMPSSA